MYAPNMDCERYQDLSGLSWFSNAPQPWAAAEHRITTDTMQMHSESALHTHAFENIQYALDDKMYTMPRSDSMEEVKTAIALNDVVPMRQHEALQVKEFIKIEEEFNCAEVKSSEDFLKMDSDLMMFDTPDLLTEIGDDLIDYIVSDDSPRAVVQSPRTLHTPPPANISIPFPSPSSSEASCSTPPPLPKPKPKMKETYLAIPRELTAGSSDDKKIPKMLILKTPNTSTINLADLSMSIAERIKTVGKRQRTKRPSETYEEEAEGGEEGEEDPEYEVKPSKRARRVSTTSSTSTSDKYRELRDRNNEASRKSRMNRKELEKEMMKTLAETERENMRLRARSDELEKLVHSLRKLLLQIVVNKGKAR